MDERDLLRRVSEMARCIGMQNWSGLAAFYDPGYRGRRGLARYQSAEEEIVRLREEVSAAGLTLTVYDLNPHVISVSDSVAHLMVAERLQFVWSDGCQRIASRQLEQRWSLSDGGWRLQSTEALPGSERLDESAALLPRIRETLLTAQRCLKPRRVPASCCGLIAALGAGFCQDIALPPQLSVAVDAQGVPPPPGEALRRACRVAMEAWNQSLHGIVELVEHRGPHRPDILIRGCNELIFGNMLGFFMFAPAMRRSRRKAQWAELRIAVSERAERRVLCLSPPDLFVAVCHELGHCFGLDECTHEGRVMAPWSWMKAAPRAPFLVERRAIARWLRTAYSLQAQAYQQLGEQEDAVAANERAAALKAEAGAAAGHLAEPRYDLLAESEYAPAIVQRYWQGGAQARHGRLDRARAHFEQALAEQTCPELLMRRGLVQPSIEGRLADWRRAVELAPGWLWAHECLLDCLEQHRPAHEAAAERERGRRLRWREEIEYHRLIASNSITLWEGAAALLKVAERSLRLSSAAVGDRLRRR